MKLCVLHARFSHLIVEWSENVCFLVRYLINKFSVEFILKILKC